MSADHSHSGEPEWVSGHAHEPNLATPDGDGAFQVINASGAQRCTLDWLTQLRRVQMADCFIFSTGHSASGPFVFGGILLADLLTAVSVSLGWRYVDVVSADGFGARIHPADLSVSRPPLLAFEIDGAPMTRKQGLVRLVVPTETDDALRQVKWIAEIRVVTDS